MAMRKTWWPQTATKKLQKAAVASWVIGKWSFKALWGIALAVAWIVLLFVDMGFSDEGGCTVVYLRDNNNQGGSCD